MMKLIKIEWLCESARPPLNKMSCSELDRPMGLKAPWYSEEILIKTHVGGLMKKYTFKQTLSKLIERPQRPVELTSDRRGPKTRVSKRCCYWIILLPEIQFRMNRSSTSKAGSPEIHLACKFSRC